jgi:predicted flap endonuclease-1-like 5' DNA nuclease
MPTPQTYTVRAPNNSFSGTRAGVHFADGEGEATEEQVRRLAARGYEVPALSVDDTPSDLEAIDGIGPARAEVLAQLGIETTAGLAEADAADVADALDKVDAETVEDWQGQV